MSYADSDQIVELGIGLADITAVYLDLADSYIDGKLNMDTGFAVTAAKTDRIDVDVANTGWVQTEMCPITAIDHVKDDMLSTAPVTISAADYDLDEEAGVIRLKNGGVFTNGHRTVEVKYSYGYAAIPAKITLLASNIVAKMIGMAKEQIENGSITQERMGDYMYKIDIGKNITQRYFYIELLLQAAYKVYGKVV